MVIGDLLPKLLTLYLVQLVEVEEPHILLGDSRDWRLAGREDGNRRPALDRRFHGLVDARPETREHAFVELLRQRAGKVEVLVERFPLELLPTNRGVLNQAFDGRAHEELFLLRRLRPG